MGGFFIVSFKLADNQPTCNRHFLLKLPPFVFIYAGVTVLHISATLLPLYTEYYLLWLLSLDRSHKMLRELLCVLRCQYQIVTAELPMKYLHS